MVCLGVNTVFWEQIPEELEFTDHCFLGIFWCLKLILSHNLFSSNFFTVFVFVGELLLWNKIEIILTVEHISCVQSCSLKFKVPSLLLCLQLTLFSLPRFVLLASSLQCCGCSFSRWRFVVRLHFLPCFCTLTKCDTLNTQSDNKGRNEDLIFFSFFRRCSQSVFS